MLEVLYINYDVAMAANLKIQILVSNLGSVRPWITFARLYVG